MAAIAIFDGEFAFQQMLLPVAHVANIKQFTIRFDAEKRDVSEPHVAAFHLPPGKYTLRFKWDDARPEVAHEGEWTGELVNEELEFTLAAAAPATGTPKTPSANDQAAKHDAHLQPATEQKLDWSEPANGLRMALAWPPSLGEPAAGETADLFAVVQNVSEAPVRLCTTAEAPDERWLDMRDDSGILQRLSSKEPSGVDVTLKPREVIFLRLLPEGAKAADRSTTGALVASDVSQILKLKLRAGLKIATAPAGAWTGTLTTPDTRAGLDVAAPANRKAQELLKVWTRHARNNGQVPGGFIARLGEHVKVFVKANGAEASGAAAAKRMESLLPRLDGSHDWQSAEASALLNDIAAVSDGVLSVMLEEIAAGKVQHGLLWEKELESAPWGQPLPNGLRTATIIGPGVKPRLRYIDWIGNFVSQGDGDKAGLPAPGAEIPLGTALGCRILIHNSGKEPVVFRVRTWHYIEPTAKDGKGADIGMESQTRFTRPPLVTFRLEPGRFIELPGPGLGLGKYGFHDFKQGEIATWIGAKEGDEVTLTPGPLPLQDWNEAAAADGEPRWWLDFIAARLNVMTPLPTDPADRRKLLDYVMRDLFWQSVQPTEEEAAAFLADTSPEALTKLAERLYLRPGVHAWSGPLQSGVTKFRVTAALTGSTKPDDAAKPAADSGQGAMLRFLESGEISFRGKSIGLAKLGAAARELPTPQVTVAAAKTAKFESVRAVLSVLWEAGISEIKINQASLDVMKVRVTPTGEVQLDGKKNVSLQDLTSLLEQERTTRGDLAVVLEGEASGSYEVLMKALDAIGKAGITQIGLVTAAREQSPGGATVDESPSSPAKKPADAPTPDKPKTGEAEGNKAPSNANPATVDPKRMPNTSNNELSSEPPPKQARKWNDQFSAVAYQSERNVNFVLVYEGFISTGLGESWSSTSGKWSIEGNIHLVDEEKTKAAGKNVDKRVIALKYTSDAPTLLYLDGKAYDLNAPWLTSDMGRISPPGRMFILRDEGDSIQTNRTLALRDEKDFETISHFAVSDRFSAEYYAESRRVQKMEGWVLGWDSQNSIQHGDGERVAQMRVFPDGRVLSLSQGQEWKDFKVPPEELAALLRWLSEDARIGEWNPEKIKSPDGLEFERDPVKNMWDRETDALFFKLDGKRHGIVAESGGSDAEAFSAIRDRLKEMSKGVTAIVQKPEAKWMTVELRKEGTLFLERKAVTIDELKSAATQHPEWRIGVEADVEVAYAKVLELADALRSINVEFGYKDGRMGDGKVHIANFQANYAFDDNHRFSICRPSSWPQFFTIGWPTKDGRSARRLRFYPEMSEQTRGKWAVAWEPGTDVLWWVDEAHVGKMTLTDPDRLVVEREGRMDRFSTGFGFPEAVQIEFRRLGLVVGQIGQIGGDADGNPSSREVLTAETVDEKGVGMSERPTVHPHDEFTDEWMSLAQEVADARGLESREMDALIAWGEENDGIRSGMLMMNRAKVGEQLKTRVVIRNVSSETKILKLSPVLNRMDAMARTPEGKQLTVRKVVLFGTDPVFSYTLKPGEQLEFPGPPIQFGLENDTDGNIKTPEWPVCGVETGPGSLRLKLSMINVRAPDTGEIEMDIANR